MGASNITATLNDIAKRAMHAHHDDRDLAAAFELLREGIATGQAAADEARSANPALANEILGSVKAMAFNLASFTWPGWDEPGIAITAEQVAIGRDAAELNYRLAVALLRPADKVATAHWLVGAHALSAGAYDEALRQFALYRDLATDDANRALAEGYIAITNLAAGRDASREFAQAVANLNGLETQDGQFFAEQLTRVRKVFARE